MNYEFMGYKVCRRVYCKLTGIGCSTLQACRMAALGGLVPCTPRGELGLRMSTGGKAAVQYLAARQWLVHYAERGAEWSPMREEAYLPAGRKSFYYAQYYFEVTAGQPGAVECALHSRQSVCGSRRVASPQTLNHNPDLVVASLKVFLEAWRVE